MCPATPSSYPKWPKILNACASLNLRNARSSSLSVNTFGRGKAVFAVSRNELFLISSPSFATATLRLSAAPALVRELRDLQGPRRRPMRTTTCIGTRAHLPCPARAGRMRITQPRGGARERDVQWPRQVCDSGLFHDDEPVKHRQYSDSDRSGRQSRRRSRKRHIQVMLIAWRCCRRMNACVTSS